MDQSGKTKKFIETVSFLLENERADSLAAIADMIGYNATSMTNVMKGRRNIPNDVYRRFTEAYGEHIPLEPADTKDEIIALLKKNNQLLEDRISSAEGEIRHIAVMNHALLLTLRDAAVQLLSKAEKSSVAEVNERLGTATAEYYKKGRRKGSLIDGN